MIPSLLAATSIDEVVISLPMVAAVMATVVGTAVSMAWWLQAQLNGIHNEIAKVGQTVEHIQTAQKDVAARVERLEDEEIFDRNLTALHASRGKT